MECYIGSSSQCLGEESYNDTLADVGELTCDRIEKVQVDQRTPLAVDVSSFLDQHFGEEEVYGATQVHQGLPCYRRANEFYDSELQRVNLNLTAWHHQLSDGDILAFSREYGMID